MILSVIVLISLLLVLVTTNKKPSAEKETTAEVDKLKAGEEGNTSDLTMETINPPAPEESQTAEPASNPPENQSEAAPDENQALAGGGETAAPQDTAGNAEPPASLDTGDNADPAVPQDTGENNGVLTPPEAEGGADPGLTNVPEPSPDTGEGENPESPVESVVEGASLPPAANPASMSDAEIMAYSNKKIEWGQGKNFDALNRPGSCVSSQQQYGALSAYFLGPWNEGEQSKIYLTFDIGYTNEATNKILDALSEKGVKAVFFTTLSVFKRSPDTIRRIINDGHILANHSATHPEKGLPSQSLDKQKAEIMDVHNYALQEFGYEMHLFRFPAGVFSEQSLAVAHSLGYKSVFWSYAYPDWDTSKQPDVSSSLQKAVERLHPGAIYLLHGISETNASLLKGFIDEARAKGYEFVLLN